MKTLISGAIGVALLAFLYLSFWHAPFQKTVPVRPLPVRFVDETGMLGGADAHRMNAYAQFANMTYGVDMRFLVIKSTGGESLENYAVDKARTLGVGADTGEKGVLCVYDTQDQRLRIEVGPKLEGVLTDAFVSYLERENTHAYVDANQLALGLNLTFQLMVRRLQQAELGEAYDPRAGEKIVDSHLLAEGAGATEAIGANGAGNGLINRNAPPDKLLKYSPQPTVEQAWQVYMDWHLEPYEYVDVPLFTPDTRQFLARQPMSRAYFDFITLNEWQQPHVVEQSGDVAMMVFTKSPFISPYYFRHTPEGWQMDILGSIRNSQELIGNAYTWQWRDGHDDYSRAFSDQVVQVGGNIQRVAGSDNRPLPVPIPASR